MKKLILFDIDETLISGSPFHRNAFVNAFQLVYGIEANIDMVNRHGMTDFQIITEILKLFNLSPGAKKEEFFKTLKQEYEILSQDEKLKPLPGVVSVLDKLQSHKVSCGLVTGNVQGIAVLKLEKAGLLSYFDISASAFGDTTVIRSELVEKVKNQGWDPIFLIGDTPKDIEAGKVAKVTTIGIATGIYSAEQLTQAGADLVIQDFKDSDSFFKLVQ